MLDTLKVFGNHATGELAQLISQGEATTQSHLEHAKQIMQMLEQQ